MHFNRYIWISLCFFFSVFQCQCNQFMHYKYLVNWIEINKKHWQKYHHKEQKKPCIWPPGNIDCDLQVGILTKNMDTKRQQVRLVQIPHIFFYYQQHLFAIALFNLKVYLPKFWRFFFIKTQIMLSKRAKIKKSLHRLWWLRIWFVVFVSFSRRFSKCFSCRM